MLEPETRHLLTDALRPPDGHSVDIAVATTYTLDLTSLLLAPMAMAAYDQESENGIDGVNALALLESIRRYADRTTVFCQAGGIHVPASYPKLATFAEGCVVEVAPNIAGRVFHPKIWALRFISAEGSYLHRLVCMSRNLTGDRSWDTVLVCQEDSESQNTVGCDDLATFLTEISALSIRALSPARKLQIQDLTTTLRSVQLCVPVPFTSARFLPLGTPSGGSWPLPDRADELIVISPFLDAGAMARLPKVKTSTVISRDHTFDRLGSGRFPNNVSPMVLQPSADGAEVDELASTESPINEVRTGLHAKVMAWDEGSIGYILTGSANCTGAAFSGNIEFNVLLSGPVGLCGAHAILDDGSDQSGLIRMLQPYEIAATEGVDDPSYVAERAIEGFHLALAKLNPVLHVSEAPDGYDLTLSMRTPPVILGRSTVRPVSLNRKVHAVRLDEEDPKWQGISLNAISPYIVVETTLSQPDVTVTRSCVLLAELIGAPSDRATHVLRELLANEAEILRYLALLLGDPSLDDMLSRFAQTSEDEEGKVKKNGGGPSFDDLILLEPLVRAASRGDASLARANELLDELRDESGNLPNVSEDFQELWRVVWEARETA